MALLLISGGAFLFMASLELKKTIQNYEKYISWHGIDDIGRKRY